MEAGEDPALDRIADVIREAGVAPGEGRPLQVERDLVRPEERDAAMHHRGGEAVVAGRAVGVAGRREEREPIGVRLRCRVTVAGGFLNRRLWAPEVMELLVVPARDAGVGA